jgi:transglutaminase-like putative cysteine protease
MKFSPTKNFFLFAFISFTLACFGEPGEPPPLVRAQEAREKGDFKGAAYILKSALNAKIDQGFQGDPKQLAYQLDMLERIRQDYSLTEKELFEKIDASVKDFSRAEFEKWLKEGRFDSLVIDGEKRFTGTSLSNLYFRHSELNARRKTPKDDAAYHKLTLDNLRKIKAAAKKENKPYVLPQRYKASITVTAEKNVAPDGQIIRAWLPIPRRNDFQGDFKLLATSSPVKYLVDEDSPIRSVYLEQAAIKDQPTKFFASFEYTIHTVRFPLDAKKIKPANNPALKPFVSEAPHVVFTPEIKALAKKIAGNETNQMLQAKAFFDWIAGNIKYSYAREYSTLTNISDYCMSNGYGDCGQEALLFITLCRSQGIPARWQTGWHLVPGKTTIHDWTEIYLAPYGWVPCDPWAGIFAMRYCVSLKPEERREVRDFYFGGLDQWRMIANSDHNAQLQPPKNSFRSDDVDFQRGELESGTNNIYFDKYSYKIEALPLDAESIR